MNRCKALALAVLAPLLLLGVAPRTVTYNAGFVGTPTRPIVGQAFAGTMRLTIYPDGIVQGNYVTQGGGLLPVTGGVEPSGKMWLQFGRATVTGELQHSGVIRAYSSGPDFADLNFVATPTKGGPGP